jgi:hypothetical protein
MKESIKTTMIALISKNYHLWIKELQRIAKKAKIWAYVNSDNIKTKSQEKEYLDVSDYQISQSQQLAEEMRLSQVLIKSIDKYSELSNVQMKKYKMNISMFKMKEKQTDKVTQELRIVNNALKHSTRFYISLNKMTELVREIVKILTFKYKRSND